MRINRILRCINPIVVNHNKVCQYCKNFDFMEDTCRKFKETDVITGKLVYFPAVKCRYDEKKCGLSAVYYDENILENNGAKSENVQLNYEDDRGVKRVTDTTVNIKLNKTMSKTIFYTIIFYYMIIPLGYTVGVFTLLSICFPPR